MQETETTPKCKQIKNSSGTGNVAHSLLLNLSYSCINMLIVVFHLCPSDANRLKIIPFVTNILCVCRVRTFSTFGHDLYHYQT